MTTVQMEVVEAPKPTVKQCGHDDISLISVAPVRCWVIATSDDIETVMSPGYLPSDFGFLKNDLIQILSGLDRSPRAGKFQPPSLRMVIVSNDDRNRKAGAVTIEPIWWSQ